MRKSTNDWSRSRWTECKVVFNCPFCVTDVLKRSIRRRLTQSYCSTTSLLVLVISPASRGPFECRSHAMRKSRRIHALFTRTWARSRFLRTSTAKIELEFTPSPAWRGELSNVAAPQYPHGEVAAELAALLTLGGERSVRAEPVSRAWKDFQRLKIVFGSFGDSNITSFYDRTVDTPRCPCRWKSTTSLRRLGSWQVRVLRTFGPDMHERFGTRRPACLPSRSRDQRGGDRRSCGCSGSSSANERRRACAGAVGRRCDMMPGTSLDDAAAWFALVGNRSEDVARELGRPELATLLDAALGLRSPDGEIASGPLISESLGRCGRMRFCAVTANATCLPSRYSDIGSSANISSPWRESWARGTPQRISSHSARRSPARWQTPYPTPYGTCRSELLRSMMSHGVQFARR